MKWGVHTAQKTLSNAKTPRQRKKAINSLNKHRTKTVNKLSNLDKKHRTLQKKYKNSVIRNDLKAAKYDMKVAKLRRKSANIKSNLYKNEKITAIFEGGLNDIDRTLVSDGKRQVAKMISNY